VDVRTLSTGDEPALEAFLRRYAASSMFLRANSRAAGLVDRGEPLQGTYVAAVDGGAIVGVAAHFWNGMLVLQAPDPRAIEPVARAAVARSGRELRGFVGPHAQCFAARSALGLADRDAALDSREELYALYLDDLRVPEDLAAGRVVCRFPRADELDIVADWRSDYSIEALGLTGGPELSATSRVEVGRLQEESSQWILEDRGRPVSYSAFNARLPDVVQVGGVWTPKELRGRGYGRAVVAGSLLDARAEGAASAVLFTGEENVPARRAYEALGFRVVGDYALIIFQLTANG
jgi:ribosomal protein S18 acetylase RimI-like enzyme